MSKHEQPILYVEPRRVLGTRDPKIYGHFVEHFHRQIYGGIFDPDSALSDAIGLRQDVASALRAIDPTVVRWPGGCFVSAYHWKDGVGSNRHPTFDKAWRVEESNAFGTDEYIAFCRSIAAEPYICTNAGTGTAEEMSDWVEYCNLPSEGKWAKLRAANGHPEPYGVRYWSIGNENYGGWEMGAKNSTEWGRFVRESAKMMKRVDPRIELLAASVPDVDWNINLLREAGDLLDWVSVHHYWDPVWQTNALAGYETCMGYTLHIREQFEKVRNILGALGVLGRIRVAFDEWNLRGWYHPHVDSATEDYLAPRDDNDVNSSYTMADAVFAACFLNECHRNCDLVGMANFAPSVNTRGAIYAHPAGIVLRSTYAIFELYTRHLGDTVVDSWLSDGITFEAEDGGETVDVPALDAVATTIAEDASLRIALVNRHPDRSVGLGLSSPAFAEPGRLVLHTVCGDSKDSFNDVDRPAVVRVDSHTLPFQPREPVTLDLPAHSASVVVFTAGT